MLRLVKNDGTGKYVYVDYEPPSGIPLRHDANYREISAWVLREYGLEISSPQVTQVKTKHGIAVQGGHNRRQTEGAEPPEVPAEIEAAIEAVLRYFRMI